MEHCTFWMFNPIWYRIIIIFNGMKLKSMEDYTEKKCTDIFHSPFGFEILTTNRTDKVVKEMMIWQQSWYGGNIRMSISWYRLALALPLLLQTAYPPTPNIEHMVIIYEIDFPMLENLVKRFVNSAWANVTMLPSIAHGRWWCGCFDFILLRNVLTRQSRGPSIFDNNR